MSLACLWHLIAQQEPPEGLFAVTAEGVIAEMADGSLRFFPNVSGQWVERVFEEQEEGK